MTNQHLLQTITGSNPTTEDNEKQKSRIQAERMAALLDDPIIRKRIIDMRTKLDILRQFNEGPKFYYGTH